MKIVIIILWDKPFSWGVGCGTMMLIIPANYTYIHTLAYSSSLSCTSLAASWAQRYIHISHIKLALSEIYIYQLHTHCRHISLHHRSRKVVIWRCITVSLIKPNALALLCLEILHDKFISNSFLDMFIMNLPRSKAGHARMLERLFYEISPSLPPKLSSCPSNTGSYWLSHDVGSVLASFNQTGGENNKK